MYFSYVLFADINECDDLDILKTCTNGCINTVGSYKCVEKVLTVTEAAHVHLITDQNYDAPIEVHREGSGENDDVDDNKDFGDDDDEGDYSGDSQSTTSFDNVVTTEISAQTKNSEEENSDFYEEENNNTNVATEINIKATEGTNSIGLTTSKEIVNNNEEKEYDQENYKDEDDYGEEYDRGDYSEEDVKYQEKTEEGNEAVATTPSIIHIDCTVGFKMNADGICSGIYFISIFLRVLYETLFYRYQRM